jgi:hypothetical protein
MIPRHLGRWRLPTSARIALALAVEARSLAWESLTPAGRAAGRAVFGPLAGLVGSVVLIKILERRT